MNRIKMLKNLCVQHYEQNYDANKLSVQQHYERNKDAKNLVYDSITNSIKM